MLGATVSNWLRHSSKDFYAEGIRKLVLKREVSDSAEKVRSKIKKKQSSICIRSAYTEKLTKFIE